MLDNDFLDHGKAQPRSLSFGGVKRPKDLGQIRGGNSRAIVRDRDALHVEAAVLFDGSPHDDAPSGGPVAGGFGGIPGKIQDRLAEQALVARDLRKIAFGGQGHLGDHVADLRDDALDQRANFMNSVMTWVIARVCSRIRSAYFAVTSLASP